ncbi:carbohydrate-binding module family 21 protein, partial [Auriscalpium vulgare]
MHKITGPRELDAARDVTLERLELAPEVPAVNGVVRVRNLAFEKWVAVRFTMDWWQTTSEVTARYVDSVEEGRFDRFAFSIKLHDVLARADEKTLFLAVRYTVEGREIWDNCGGANYQAKITREKAQPAEEKKGVVSPKKNASAASSGSEIEDLRSKLEQVVMGRASETVGSRLAHSRQRWGTLSPTPSPQESKPPTFRTEPSLSSRYDFAESLRNPWRAPASPQHTRTSTYPA